MHAPGIGHPDIRLRRLERALARTGTHDIVDLVRQIKRGAAQVWEHGDSVVITEVLAYPRTKTLHYWLVAGDLEDIMALEPDIEEWARGQGCIRFEAYGRPGWDRVAKHAGWRPQAMLWVKEDRHGRQ